LQDILLGRSGITYELVCITETWLNDQISDQLVVANNNYVIYRCDRSVKGGGGCAIIVNNSLCSRQVSFPSDFIFNDFQCICVELENKSGKIAICCIYNPPGCKIECITALCRVFDYICSKYVHICVVGDFNLPRLALDLNSGNWVNTKYKCIGDVVTQYGLQQLVKSPTRFDNVLDLLFCTCHTVCSDAIVSNPFSSSDHASIVFKIFTECSNLAKAPLSYRDFKSGDWQAFEIFLNNVPWYALLSCTDSVDIVWSKFCMLYKPVLINLYLLRLKRRKIMVKSQLILHIF
jgi:hypothetical protein